MVLQIVFRTEFSLLLGGLGRCAESNSVPWNQPTVFHPILIVAKLLKCLLSLIELLSQRCHLSRIDEKKLFAIVTARRTFAKSFPSHVKSLFRTDKIEPIEWQDLEQRQRTGDCFLIHTPH